MKIEFFTTHRPTTGWLPVAIDTPLNGATTTSFFYHFVSCVPFGKHGTSLSPALAGGQTVAHCQKPFYCTPKCAAQAPASTPARRRRVVRLVVMCVAEYQTQNIPSWHSGIAVARVFQKCSNKIRRRPLRSPVFVGCIALHSLDSTDDDDDNDVDDSNPKKRSTYYITMQSTLLRAVRRR